MGNKRRADQNAATNHQTAAVDDLLGFRAREEERERAGSVHGRHYTDYVEEVKDLKRQGRLDDAIELLGELMDAVERENELVGWGPAPWYFEHSAICYRKLKQREAEVAVLERYVRTCQVGNLSAQDYMVERLAKAKELREKHGDG